MPLDKKAAFHAGSGELQVVAMAVRTLLDNDYKTGMEVQVRDALKNLPDGFQITPDVQAGEQKGGEIIGQSESLNRRLPAWSAATIEEARLRVHMAVIRKALGERQFGSTRSPEVVCESS